MTLTRQSLFYVGIFLGEVGAFGQALLLFHELVDSLPYKEMGLGVYQSIAETGIWVAPIVSLIAATYLGRKALWLTVVVPVILSPLLFAAIFKSYSFAYGLDIEDLGGDFTPLRAEEQFYSNCLSLIGVGLAVGMVLACILALVTRRKIIE